MEIRLGTETAEIEIAEGDTEEDVAARIASLDAAEALAKKAGEDSFYAAFETWEDMEDRTARAIAGHMLGSGNGENGLDDFFFERKWLQDPYDFFHSNTKSELADLLMEAAEAVAAETDLDAREIAETAANELSETCIDAMLKADSSSPLDAIPAHVKVELPFIPDYGLIGIEDLATNHFGVAFSAETAIPDAAFMRMLKFFNVSPREFVEEAEKRGINLRDPDLPEGISDYRRSQAEENALRWRAVLDLETGSSENISKLPLSTRGQIADWNETVKLAKTAKDHDRPAALSMDALFDVLDNASYGGVPCYVMRASLRDIVQGKFNRPFLATGGFIGLHDFINGSGHIEAPDGPVLIDPSKGSFRVRDSRDEVDDVYGIVHRYYEASVAPVEVSPWQRIREDMWLRREGDGREAVVTRTTAGEGTEEFWIATADADGEAAGPRATAEVYLSLEEAKAAGDRALSEEWAAAPAP